MNARSTPESGANYPVTPTESLRITVDGLIDRFRTLYPNAKDDEAAPIDRLLSIQGDDGGSTTVNIRKEPAPTKKRTRLLQLIGIKEPLQPKVTIVLKNSRENTDLIVNERYVLGHDNQVTLSAWNDIRMGNGAIQRSETYLEDAICDDTTIAGLEAQLGDAHYYSESLTQAERERDYKAAKALDTEYFS